MRWWLALAFAAIAAVTAIAVAEVFTQRAERAFSGRAQELAAGNGLAAANVITQAVGHGALRRAVRAESERRRLSLFVFDAENTLLAGPPPGSIQLRSVPLRKRAISEAVRGRRFVRTAHKGETIVVAVPLRIPGAAVLLAVASRPDLVAGLGTARDTIVEAALWAVLVGAVVGLLVAVLISARLRRIAAAAAAIEGGRFETRLEPRFRDELGELAATVDRMRARLRETFTSLESERDRLLRLLEQLQEGVVAVDGALEVQFANGPARDLLRARSLAPGDQLPEPWPGFSLRALASSLFRAEATVAEARVSPDPQHAYAIIGIPPAPGAPTAVLVLADASERERRERAEREFVANAAHELRTPVAAITSAVEVLQAGAKEDVEERDRFLRVIERQATRLGRLARALLVLARAQTREEALRLEPVELRPLLEEVAAGVDTADGVRVEVACPPGLVALAQRDLAEQVLSNLVANAAKYAREGRILLAARPGDRRSVTIEVTDSGPGIRAEEQERIFDRFYSGATGEREGFGLGLAIVRDAVRALGGGVEIESVPGVGTTARVTLAAAETRAA